jgi:hypothetical protein
VIWLTIFVLSVFVGVGGHLQGFFHPARRRRSVWSQTHSTASSSSEPSGHRSTVAPGSDRRLIAVVLAAINYGSAASWWTDRMLQMFTGRKKAITKSGDGA